MQRKCKNMCSDKKKNKATRIGLIQGPLKMCSRTMLRNPDLDIKKE